MTVDAILLASFGGPEGPDEVMPFLERVTAGRGVPRERLEVVAEHYLALGGVSPINAQNRLLLAALRAELDRRGIELPIFWGNRNSAPFFTDAVRDAHAAGCRSILALATSAYSSYSGCRQYRENIAVALAQSGLEGDLDVVKLLPYYARDGFVQPFAGGVRAALAALEARGVREDDMVVLFTTHSIPTSMALGSGPDEGRPTELPGRYEQQHLEVAARVMTDLDVPWRLVFQSRSGPPQVPWLEPDINDAIREEAEAGRRAVVVAPIGFVSDHVEVVWDLDHEGAATAAEVGIEMVRVPTPGIDPDFVAALGDAIQEAVDGVIPTSGLCSATCCANARGEQPTIPGLTRAH